MYYGRERVGVMEVANVRAMEVTNSANSTKRRKLNSGDQLLQPSSSNDQLANQCRFAVNSPENSISQVTSGTASDQIPVSLYLSNQCVKDSSRSLDPKAENFGTDLSISISGGFSRGKRSSSEICSEHSEVMESSKTKKKPSPAANYGEAKTPSTAEIEEFFSVAEKYEQKRFANKYNYDIVKDVPLEGRYQWVRIKP